MSDVEVSKEVDGRWIAEVSAVPGAIADGATREEAEARARAIADGRASLLEAIARVEAMAEEWADRGDTACYRPTADALAMVAAAARATVSTVKRGDILVLHGCSQRQAHLLADGLREWARAHELPPFILLDGAHLEVAHLSDDEALALRQALDARTRWRSRAGDGLGPETER